jgi:dTDP-4-dehydrorhamnose reductase
MRRVHRHHQQPVTSCGSTTDMDACRAGIKWCASSTISQRGCPTAARDIARVCLDIASHCAAEPASAPYGTYHFAGGGEASWYEFAKTIVELAGPRLGKSPEVVAIGSADYPTPAARPADTRLDCTSIAKIFGIRPRPWREALVETIDRLFSNKGAS